MNGNELKATITKVSEVTVIDNGLPKTKTRVVYSVGPHGPFTRDYDTATFNAATARADIDAYAATLKNLVGY